MLDILKFPKYSKYELHIIELMWSDRTMKYEIYFIVSVDQIEKWINSRSPDLIKKKTVFKLLKHTNSSYHNRI